LSLSSRETVVAKGRLSNPTSRLCRVCGGSYLPVRDSQKFCSPKCGNSQAARRLVDGDLLPRPCTRCEQEFSPKTRRQKTCGAECPGRPALHKDCIECGALFVASRKGGGKFVHTYCSEKCRESASRRRRGERFRKYALTELEYLALVDEQGNRCKACGDSPSAFERWGLVVDHDHETGAVRGLLCNRCNMGLGLFDDDPDKLLSASAYLLAWKNRDQSGESIQDGTGRPFEDHDVLMSGLVPDGGEQRYA
jgi:hypothetical protein